MERSHVADQGKEFATGDGAVAGMNDPEQLDQLCITTIRTLSIDAVQKANSGHPGTPMGMAPAAYCLWQRFLRFGFDAAHVITAAKEQLARHARLRKG